MLRLIAPLLPDIRRTFILISILFISQPPSRTLFTTSSPSLHPPLLPLGTRQGHGLMKFTAANATAIITATAAATALAQSTATAAPLSVQVSDPSEKSTKAVSHKGHSHSHGHGHGHKHSTLALESTKSSERVSKKAEKDALGSVKIKI